jgi:hypothetical protein
MTNEQLTLLGILLTVLVTIIGWIYTASVQNTILRETQKAHNLNREIIVFRERLNTIKDITSKLVSQSASYNELATLIKSGRFRIENIVDMLNRLVNENFEITKYFVDPMYRSICKLLSDKDFERLGKQVGKLLDSIDLLDTYKMNLNPLPSQLDQGLIIIADQAESISGEMMDTANIFADLFADLDKHISSDSPT